jgi:hypothetical protein
LWVIHSVQFKEGLYPSIGDINRLMMMMGSPPVTSAVFLVASNFGKMWVSGRNI